MDYRVGFAVLLSLSAGHVILEFPLDHRTAWGVGREVKKLFGGGALARERAFPP